ncbi:unnamed protein product [Prorocentrum cordatum]|uniref:Uncharacterized protein n=2 Tax=Prorocentrum cordatum TaxID=2364126 RepID=A0ABN9T9T9_9DINO|nr:unnamed protein product [Polarella glacialis]
MLATRGSGRVACQPGAAAQAAVSPRAPADQVASVRCEPPALVDAQPADGMRFGLRGDRKREPGILPADRAVTISTHGQRHRGPRSPALGTRPPTPPTSSRRSTARPARAARGGARTTAGRRSAERRWAGRWAGRRRDGWTTTRGKAPEGYVEGQRTTTTTTGLPTEAPAAASSARGRPRPACWACWPARRCRPTGRWAARAGARRRRAGRRRPRRRASSPTRPFFRTGPWSRRAPQCRRRSGSSAAKLAARATTCAPSTGAWPVPRRTSRQWPTTTRSSARPSSRGTDAPTWRACRTTASQACAPAWRAAAAAARAAAHVRGGGRALRYIARCAERAPSHWSRLCPCRGAPGMEPEAAPASASEAPACSCISSEAYTCEDGEAASCEAGEECYSDASFGSADWSSGCARSMSTTTPGLPGCSGSISCAYTCSELRYDSGRGAIFFNDPCGLEYHVDVMLECDNGHFIERQYEKCQNHPAAFCTCARACPSLGVPSGVLELC